LILAFDTYYYNNSAKTVAVQFENWIDQDPISIESEIKNDVVAYEPGSFYKRELPCIISLLKKFNLQKIKYIVIDGYCILNNQGKFGLGGYLYEHLNRKITIIGVAKTSFFQNTDHVFELLRGESIKPLFITAIGIPLQQASKYISNMHGEYRMPTLLQIVDRHTKTKKVK
jgi:deoxyribonuclease V